MGKRKRLSTSGVSGLLAAGGALLNAATKKSEGHVKKKHKTKSKKSQTEAKIKTKLMETNHVAQAAKDDVSTINQKFFMGKAQERAKHHKVIGRFKYVDTYQSVIIPVAGQQQAQFISVILNYDQLGGTAGAPNYYGDKTKFVMFEMDPNAKITGSAVGSAFGAGTNPASTAVKMLDVNQHMSLTNLSNIPAYVDVYTIRAKRDGSNDPITFWRSCLQEEGLGNTAMTYPAAGATTGSVAGYGTEVSPFLRPQNIRGFNKEFKVMGKHHLKLSAGAEVTVNHEFVYNKLCLKDWLGVQTTTILKGWTVYTMVIVRGQVVGDITAGAGAELYTYGSPKIACVVNRQYNLQAVDASKKVNAQLGVSFIPANADITKEKHIDYQDLLASVIVA